jgi:hypothetical protein
LDLALQALPTNIAEALSAAPPRPSENVETIVGKGRSRLLNTFFAVLVIGVGTGLIMFFGVRDFSTMEEAIAYAVGTAIVMFIVVGIPVSIYVASNLGEQHNLARQGALGVGRIENIEKMSMRGKPMDMITVLFVDPDGRPYQARAGEHKLCEGLERYTPVALLYQKDKAGEVGIVTPVGGLTITKKRPIR